MNETPTPPPNPELEEQGRQLWAKILSLQERFAYFFLALTGSAIAYAVSDLKDEKFAPWMLPVLLAIASWGISFLLSALHLLLKLQVLNGDWRGVLIQLGREPITRDNPSLRDEALRRLDRDKRRRDAKSGTYARWVLYLFLAGAIIYLVGIVQKTLS